MKLTLKQYITKNYSYEYYGKLEEERMLPKLLENGFTKEQVEEYRENKKACIGCGWDRDNGTHKFNCQCAYCGSAHPDDRTENVIQRIKEYFND